MGSTKASSALSCKARSCCRCRHENDSDLYCAFDPDVAHMLAGWGLDWRQTHCLGQATVEVGLQHMWGHDSAVYSGPCMTNLSRQPLSCVCSASVWHGEATYWASPFHFASPIIAVSCKRQLPVAL